MKELTLCYKIVTFINSRGNPQWRLVAVNGRILAHSEEYSSKRARDDTVNKLSKMLGLMIEEGKDW